MKPSAVAGSYSFDPPSAPARHEVHTPKPLALPMMLAQRPVMLACSAALRVAGVNCVSVVAKLPAVGVACSVVRYAVIPFASVPGLAAELLQVVPVPLPPASVESSFTVTEVGTTPVSVFEVRSAFTPRFTV